MAVYVRDGRRRAQGRALVQKVHLGKPFAEMEGRLRNVDKISSGDFVSP